MTSATILYGDGIHDDAPAIQSLLDSGKPCIYLPPPDNFYLIGQSLLIHSNQELRLDRYTTVRLAPLANCQMVKNDFANGGRNIAVTGGIWDYDNMSQWPNPAQLHHVKNPPPSPYPKGYSGIPLEFSNVDGLCLKGITVRDPAYFAITFHKVTNFVVDDIEFDFRHCNPVPANMDGVHLCGSCRYGRITNLRGTCYDDLLALNAPEGHYPGDITDIDVDGIHCDYCHSAVRIYAFSQTVRNVTIRNIHGNFYRYMVGFTHFLINDIGPARFENITGADCYCGKAPVPECPVTFIPFPLILMEGFAEYDNIFLRNLHRTESTEAMPMIAYNVAGDRKMPQDAHARNMTIENCSMENRLAEPLEFFHCEGPIDHLVLRNNRMLPVSGKCLLITGDGRIDCLEATENSPQETVPDSQTA